MKQEDKILAISRQKQHKGHIRSMPMFRSQVVKDKKKEAKKDNYGV